MSSNRVTIQEIGDKLNISASTVSRALRQDPLIHPETRARVNTLAMDLGYQGRARQGPNRSKRTNSLAVLFSATSLAQIQSGYITTCYLQGLTAEAEHQGIGMNIHTVLAPKNPDYPETAGIPRSLWSGECDAAIVVGHQQHEMVKILAQKTSVISLVWEYPEVAHDLVNTPDLQGLNMIVKELVQLGHRRLAWIGGAMQGSFVEGRKAGFVFGCISNHLPLSDQTFFDHDLFDGEAVSEPGKLVAAYRRGVTGYLCASDETAKQVIEVFRAEGVRVPQDVSVTGFNNVLGKGPDGVNLVASLDPQFVEMGRTAVRLAKWRLEQPSAMPVTLSLRAKFVPGRSIGPALV